MMKRTPLLSLGIAGLGAAALPTSAQAQAPRTEQDRPNVIVILADDLGFGDISCNGSRTIATPNIDRIAAEGIRFTNAHTTSSTSTPARFGLLTGIYPWRVPGTGIAPGDAGMIIRPGTPTLASTLRDAGYTTGAVGKWHLGLGESGRQDWNGHITPGLEEIGFDYSFIMAATGDRVPCVYIENQRVYNYDPEAPISVSYKENFPGEPTGRDNPELLRLHPSHGHDMSIVNGISRIGYMKGGGKALWKDEEIADVITGKAVEFIEKNRERPFFLYFGTNDIHVPRVPHKRFAGRSGMGARGDAILSFDWSVGRIARVLDSLGIADRTILIVTSDNGPSWTTATATGPSSCSATTARGTSTGAASTAPSRPARACRSSSAGTTAPGPARSPERSSARSTSSPRLPGVAAHGYPKRAHRTAVRHSPCCAARRSRGAVGSSNRMRTAHSRSFRADGNTSLRAGVLPTAARRTPSWAMLPNRNSTTCARMRANGTTSRPNTPT